MLVGRPQILKGDVGWYPLGGTPLRRLLDLAFQLNPTSPCDRLLWQAKDICKRHPARGWATQAIALLLLSEEPSICLGSGGILRHMDKVGRAVL